ncbi:MAG: NB-ARC domain-containing protein, partial [Cyanobacteria bacterium J06635_1]
MDFGEALKLVDGIVTSNMGRSLRNPEIAILEGTWNGFTYEQIAHVSEYSTNYLMRDVAPKLWKFLSDALGTSVGKTNFRIVLDEVAGKNAVGTTLDTPDAASLLSTSGLSTPNLQVAWESEGFPESLATLRQWILEDRCQLLSIYGLSGAGKTVLARRLIESIGDQFEQVIWQSSISPLSQLAESIAGHEAQGVIADYSDPVSALIEVLSRRACLIVIDAVESILQPGELAGRYRSGYENYGHLLRRVGELPHRSCLVITGLENPPEIARLSGQSSSVRALHLKEFSETAAVA